MGMRPIAIDGGEAKRKLCLNMGAEAFIDFTKTSDVAAEVVKIADGVGAHGVLVTAYQAYRGNLFFIAKKRGRLADMFTLPRFHELRWKQIRRKDYVHRPTSCWRGPTR